MDKNLVANLQFPPSIFLLRIRKLRYLGIFGNNNIYDSPGWKFVFGSQDSEIRRVAAENGWLVKNDYLKIVKLL